MRVYWYFVFFMAVSTPTQPFAAAAQALKGDKLKDSLKQSLVHANNDTSRIKTLFALGNAYAASDSATAVQYANEERKLSEKQHWQKGVGLYNLLMAKVYRNLSDNRSCLRYAAEAYGILKNTDDQKSTAAALVYMANSYQATGFFARSIENNLAALRIYETMNNVHGIALCYNNIGVNYYGLRQYDNAIENYKKALALRQQEGDQYEIGSDLDNIAIVFKDRGNYDSADVYNQAGIKMFEAVDNQAALGRIYANRGYLLLRMFDAESAAAFNRKSLAIDEKLGIPDGIGYAYGFMGEIYLDLANDSAGRFKRAPFMKKDKRILLDSAEYYLTRGISWAHKAEDLNLLMDHSLLLSGVEEQLGKYPAALKSHREYTLFKDSIFSDENRQKISAMETERLTQTKDHEIALQSAEAKRQALLKKVIFIAASTLLTLICLFALLYNRRKKAAFDHAVMKVEIKALRAQMDPHFISNALHSINKYIQENDKGNASLYLSKFASLMRLILENSREQEVSLEQELHALELYIQMELLRFNNGFTYEMDVDPQIDQENTLIPPMLLQPFVENAILHGFRSKANGMIAIQVRKVNGMISCVIEDSGTDIPAVEPADTKVHKSLGQIIISERLNIINRLKKTKATVNISKVKNEFSRSEGVRVELLLPIVLAF